MAHQLLKIDPTEAFPHLSRAPIVEAVIDFRAFTGKPWDQTAHREALQKLLPDYPTAQPQRTIQHELVAQVGQLPVPKTVDLGPSGLMLKSKDGRQVAQFQRTGFVFSRLEPYHEWGQFFQEALRLLEIHRQISQPTEISRVGVRFINRMKFPAEHFDLGRYLFNAPASPGNLPLPLASFVHQERYIVPDSSYPYLVNLIRTIQPVEGVPPSVPVILDIDAFIQQPIAVSPDLLTLHLTNLHWIKNKIFFASVSPAAIDLFK